MGLVSAGEGGSNINIGIYKKKNCKDIPLNKN